MATKKKVEEKPVPEPVVVEPEPEPVSLSESRRPVPAPEWVDGILAIGEQVEAIIADPETPDIFKVPLVNIRGNLSHLRDATYTWRSLYREGQDG